MIEQSSGYELSQKLNIPKPIFLFTMGILFLGLGLGVLTDLATANPWRTLNNAPTFLVLILATIYCSSGRWKTSSGLYFSLLEICRNFYCSHLITVFERPFVTEDQFFVQEIILVNSIAGMVLGIAVNKHAALLFSLLSVTVQVVALWVFPDVSILKPQFFINTVIVCGSLLVIYYYRNFLERLIHLRTLSLRRINYLRGKAEDWEKKNQPYVIFGRNTAGFVHDFRNYVNVLMVNVQTLNLLHKKGRNLDVNAVSDILEKLKQLEERISLINYQYDAGKIEYEEQLDLPELFRAVLYPFSLSSEVRHSIVLEYEVAEGSYFWGRRQVLLRVLENLVRNSCEAILDHRKAADGQGEGSPKPEPDETAGPPAAPALKERTPVLDPGYIGRIILRAKVEKDSVLLEVEDDGPGIAACSRCDQEHDCEACGCFKIGKTSKTYGSGYGMVNVLSSVKAQGGHVRIFTRKDLGTRIRIFLPKQEPMLPF